MEKNAQISLKNWYRVKVLNKSLEIKTSNSGKRYCKVFANIGTIKDGDTWLNLTIDIVFFDSSFCPNMIDGFINVKQGDYIFVQGEIKFVPEKVQGVYNLNQQTNSPILRPSMVGQDWMVGVAGYQKQYTNYIDKNGAVEQWTNKDVVNSMPTSQTSVTTSENADKVDFNGDDAILWD